ncbi:sialate O-acetylesterase [Aestuariibaculum sediminum]|uniref:Sialate O-acetylesterase n=1 Tax=Aestuariibaculum sediminum TaxID=2770637 RepID=A0A8J6PZJ7_9FLAO|nr:sialate O-acetylesterase [Aestuariibaculum sediminum]MBD0831622.1 sialate O-acetylesterase [Aestuariibaculum sediminum]
MKRFLLGLLLVWGHTSFAKIWTSSVISDGMVLQRNTSVTIWGWTSETIEPITVIGSWDNVPVTQNAYQGKWSVQLPTPDAGGPYTVTIKGHEAIILSNVLIGEVWIASGQSNMEWTASNGITNAKEEINNAVYPNIRLFNVPKHQSASRQNDTKGNWTECSPNTMKDFSAVAYFFGRELHKELNIPIGLINSSWGGTRAEVWFNANYLKSKPHLVESKTHFTENKWHTAEPGYMFNAMVAPLIPFKIAGAIWYQGEANRVSPHIYKDVLSALIENWRAEWGYNFPFYFVQIAPFNYKEKHAGVLIREAQLKTFKDVYNTGMVVVSDIGNINNIHPKNKQDVGKRLAQWALTKNYNDKGKAFSGPIYREVKKEGQKMVIYFDYAEDGLMKNGDELTEFEICGADKIFIKARAKIKGDIVMVWHNKIKNPLAVRFAWNNKAEPNLYNKAGLPASCFRTDDWDIQIEQNNE